MKLWTDVLAQYIVCVEPVSVQVQRDSPIPVGLVSLYDADLFSRIVWAENVGLPGDHHERVRDRAFTELIGRAFIQWDFRKVCGIHHGFQAPVFAGVHAMESHEEVRLENVYRHDGMYWDRVFSAIERDRGD